MTDPRYDTVKCLLEQGAIKKFTDIFDWIPKTVVAADLKTNTTRMTKLIENPELFATKDIVRLADLLGYDPKKLVLMAVAEVENKNPGSG